MTHKSHLAAAEVTELRRSRLAAIALELTTGLMNSAQLFFWTEKRKASLCGWSSTSTSTSTSTSSSSSSFSLSLSSLVPERYLISLAPNLKPPDDGGGNEAAVPRSRTDYVSILGFCERREVSAHTYRQLTVRSLSTEYIPVANLRSSGGEHDAGPLARPFGRRSGGTRSWQREGSGERRKVCEDSVFSRREPNYVRQGSGRTLQRSYKRKRERNQRKPTDRQTDGRTDRPDRT